MTPPVGANAKRTRKGTRRVPPKRRR
jgi:hypothetical protein